MSASEDSEKLGSIFSVVVTAKDGVPLDRIEKETREVLADFVQNGPTPDELKRQVAGDLVVVGVDGEREAALELFRPQPFVREASADDEDGTIRLYVDRGESAMPAILRLLDGAGLELKTITLTRPSLDDVFLRQTGRSLREVAA